MWIAHQQDIERPAGAKIAIVGAGGPCSFAETIANWRDSEAFRDFFIAGLAALPFAAFFWEMPPLRRGQSDLPYEYAALRGDELARRPANPDAFSEYLEGGDPANTIVSFRNLGGDALLVAPKPMAAPDAYGHIGAFVRLAPPRQRHRLFQTLADAILRMLKDTEGPIWISTSGLGVPWVHVRLDTHPKYYSYPPYATG